MSETFTMAEAEAVLAKLSPEAREVFVSSDLDEVAESVRAELEALGLVETVTRVISDWTDKAAAIDAAMVQRDGPDILAARIGEDDALEDISEALASWCDEGGLAGYDVDASAVTALVAEAEQAIRDTWRQLTDRIASLSPTKAEAA